MNPAPPVTSRRIVSLHLTETMTLKLFKCKPGRQIVVMMGT